MTATTDLEHACCPVCSSCDEVRTGYGSGPYRVVRCRVCDLWYLSPRLNERAMLAAYERPDYFEGSGSGYTAYAAQRRSLVATFRRLLATMGSRGIRGESLLDVGCGYGYLLEAAAGAFVQRVGTDFSMEAAREARTRADAVFVGGVESLPDGSTFDCITALHVIEHVYAPAPFCQALLERLNPGGWLVVATPDMGSWWRRLMGNRWPSFKMPEHVAFYDGNTLASLLGSLHGAGRTIPIPYPHAFPLAEVGAKIGLAVPGLMADVNIWIPQTTVCVAVQRS